jgi:DNA-binding NarL/FixJ family response regulator
MEPVKHQFGDRRRLLQLSIAAIGFASASLALFIFMVTGTALIVVWVGVPVVVETVVKVRWLAELHRRRVGELLGEPIESPYLRRTEGNLLDQVRGLLRDPATWRDTVWLIANGTLGLALACVAVCEAVLDLLFWWLPPGLAMRAYARLSRALLAPSEKSRLALRVEQLTESRAETVDTQAAELRRIERDLHDGAQARLVALGMNLALAEDELARNPGAAKALLSEAREASSNALAELRDLVRGIHPPVLADRGLVGAVQALSLIGPVPVEVRPGRVGRLLRRRRRPRQRDQAQRRAPHVDHAQSGERSAEHGGARRRHGRRRSLPRHRFARHRPAPVGVRRRARGVQPTRRTDRAGYGLAVRVVLAEDLALLRDGLIRLLEANDCEVVEAVDNGPSLLRALTTHRPDIAVVDVRLPPTFTDEGLRAAIEARAQVKGLPVLVLSQYVEQLYARELLADRSGGVGYLLKDRVFNVAQFIDAVRQVAAGGTAMDPEVVAQLLTRRSGDKPLASLTPREREVLEAMAEGRSNAAIAARMFVTEKAVSKHTNSIFSKLDLPPSEDDNRRVLAVLAYLNG